jgi:prolyl-tRNA synthetase
VLFDDRSDVSAGEKFADADLIGIPYRVVVSKRSLADGGYELKKRIEPNGKVVPSSELLDLLAANV